MQVTTSTGTDTLNPGDSFTVTFSGMRPGDVVRMEGPGNRYLPASTPIHPDGIIGTADGSGRLSYTWVVLPIQADPKFIAQVWSNTFSINNWAAGAYEYNVPHTFIPTAQQIAVDPFLTPANQLPAGSAYANNQPNNTPLINWSGGLIQAVMQMAQQASNSGGDNKVPSINFSAVPGTIVGASWNITISGAKPGGQVTAKVGTDVTPFGTVDNGGNWSKSGVFGSGDVGHWDEVWMVDGVVIGEWHFNVTQSQSSNVQQQQTGGSGQTNTTNASTNAGATAQLASGASALGSDWVGVLGATTFGVPNWMLGVGALAALFMVSGNRR
jgi:hypothetical protein